MNNNLIIIATACMTFTLQGCITVPSKNVSQTTHSQCSSPRATIAIADFENKSGNRYAYKASQGLAENIAGKLLNSGCFNVVDRNSMKQIMQEQGLSGSGLVSAASAARVGQLTGADLLLFGSITQYNKKKNNSKKAFVKETVRMELNARMTSVENGRMLVSETVVGNGQNTSYGNILGGDLGKFLDETDDQGAENKAVDDMESKIVPKLITAIPSSYTGRSTGKKRSSGKSTLNARIAQRVLKETGFYNGNIDGDFGPKSRKALKSFQLQFDLSPTGNLDSTTMDKINSLSQ